MATIKINNLNTAGSDLFNDSESFLNELTEQEVNMTNGGISPVIVISVSVSVYAYGKYKGWW